MKEWMKGWMKEWKKKKWKDERMNEWMNGLPDRWAPSPGIIYPNSTIPAHGSKKPKEIIMQKMTFIIRVLILW